jgi:hypothetical protein
MEWRKREAWQQILMMLLRYCETVSADVPPSWDSKWTWNVCHYSDCDDSWWRGKHEVQKPNDNNKCQLK